jgi:N-acyl-D-amino-acid deacylase
MALMTRTSPSSRLPHEVFYFDGPTSIEMYSIYDDDTNVRHYSYGGFDGTAIDAHGGWIASASDLCHFLNGVDGKSGRQILSPKIIKEMLARPDNPFWRGKETYYALGWNVTPGSTTMSHAGAIISGTCSVVARLPGEITLAAVCNHVSSEPGPMVAALGQGLQDTARSITSWPTS